MLKESSLENTSVGSTETEKKELVDVITEKDGECGKMTNREIGDVAKGLTRTDSPKISATECGKMTNLEIEDAVKGLAHTGSPKMTKSVSMLEMSEIADIHEFHNAMCFQSDIDDLDEGFQIGGIDLDECDDKVQQKQQPKEDKVEVKSSGLGLRKNMSMINLRSTPADLDTIKEHGITNVKSVQKTAPPTLERSSSGSMLPKKSAMKKVSSFASFSSMDSIPEAQDQYPFNNDPQSESGKSLKRNVSFSNLEVREYPMTLGDNPCVSFGAPVSLAWQYDNAYTVDLEKYEKNREPRREKHQMILSYYAREDLVRRSGCTREELKQMIKDVNKMKNQRQTTYALLPASKVEEALESARRKIKRYIKIKPSGGSKS